MYQACAAFYPARRHVYDVYNLPTQETAPVSIPLKSKADLQLLKDSLDARDLHYFC